MAEHGNNATGAWPDSLPQSVSSGSFAGDRHVIAHRLAWGIFGLVFLVHLLDSLDRWLLPAVLRPVSEELELTDIQAGWLATILLLSYAVWSPIIGYLADRFRRPRLMAIGIAVWSLATVGTGLARSYDQLQLARVLVGIGGSTFGVIAMTFLMDLFPRGVRARVLSAYYLAMPLGAALGWAWARRSPGPPPGTRPSCSRGLPAGAGPPGPRPSRSRSGAPAKALNPSG